MRVTAMFILMLILGCTVEAQESDPRPQGVSVDSGNTPAPWVEISWETPPDSVRYVAVDIKGIDGTAIRPAKYSRPGYSSVPVKHIGSDWVWPNYETYELQMAGCEASREHLRLTEQCLRRFEKFRTVFNNLNPGFLKAGQTYEVQVLYELKGKGGFPSSQILSTTIPRLATPTPVRIRSTATAVPWFTPKPIPSDDKDRRIRELEYRVSELERKLRELTSRVSNLDGLNTGW